MTADCVADVLLTGLPVLLLRGMKLNRKRKLLILSTFSASMVINVVTVVQAVVLFQYITSGTIIVGHVKVSGETAWNGSELTTELVCTFIDRMQPAGDRHMGLPSYEQGRERSG